MRNKSIVVMILLLIMSNFTFIAKDKGEQLNTLTEIPVLYVDSINTDLSGTIDADYLVFRYAPDETNPNYQWNGQDISNALPADTQAFAQTGAIKLVKGDKITYNNKFGKVVTLEAMNVINDFFINKKSPRNPFLAGNQFLRNPAGELKFSIQGETRPSYLSFVDLDYSDSVGVKKSDIYKILVMNDTEITYTEHNDYIYFHGLQGNRGTSSSNTKVWATILLKNSETTVKILSGNLTLIDFVSSELFKEVKTGNVFVRYETEDGQLLESSDVTKGTAVGTEYTTEQKVFLGYHFIEMKASSAPMNGTVTDEDQTVVYVYAKNTGNVFVRYETEDGQLLESSDVTKGTAVGTEYKTEQKVFPGYHFIEMKASSAPMNGTVTDEDQTVVYVYAKNTQNITVPEQTIEPTNLQIKPIVDTSDNTWIYVVINFILICMGLSVILKKRNI